MKQNHDCNASKNEMHVQLCPLLIFQDPYPSWITNTDPQLLGIHDKAGENK